MDGKPVMRILVLASTYPRWPADTLPPFVHELALRLATQHEVHVLAPHARGCETREVMDGVQVHRFRYGPEGLETLAYASGMLPGLRRRPWRLLGLPVFLFAEWFAALRLLRQRRFDAIHAHWLLPHGLIALMARACCGYRPALVCTSHGADLYGLRGALARALKRLVLRRSDRVTVVSQAMQEDLRREAGDVSNCCVLPMGVDTQSRFGLPASPVTRSGLLFVGRLADKKGVDVLLAALARLKDTPDLRLHVIGSGPEEAGLKRQTASLGLDRIVEFVGPVPNRDLPQWYQRSAILVFPSVVTAYGDREGLGLVPIEALSCGCAVVASDLPAVRDVIRHGATGLMARPGDPDDLASALARMLEDPALRDRLTAAGRDDMRARFDWGRIAERYSDVFLSLRPGAQDLEDRR
jgi:glycosyltransferase involved in cell wall biosynthesis